MKIKILAIGKVKKGPILGLCQDYLQRIAHWNSIEVHEISSPVASVKTPRSQALNQEAVAIEKVLKKSNSSDTLLVSLDEKGVALTSEKLAHRLEDWLALPKSELIFLIGGAYGLSEKLKEQAFMLLSLSKLTLPHQLARVVLLEQIYRAFSIIKKTPYHHE